jgi:hypothetical protein
MVHTPLHFPQARQDRRNHVTASAPSAGRMGLVDWVNSASTARVRLLRHRRVAVRVGFMAPITAQSASAAIADVSSFWLFTNAPKITRCGQQTTPNGVLRVLRMRKVFGRSRVSHSPSKGRAKWRLRKDSMISGSPANQCTPHATVNPAAHEHARPASPRMARRCAPALPGVQGERLSLPLPQFLPCGSLPNWAVRSVEQASGPLFGQVR